MQNSRIAHNRRPGTVTAVLVGVVGGRAVAGRVRFRHRRSPARVSSSTVGQPSKSTPLGIGVTATSIKVGVSLLDYSCVEAYHGLVAVRAAGDLPDVHQLREPARWRRGPQDRAGLQVVLSDRDRDGPGRLHGAHRGPPGVRGARDALRPVRRLRRPASRANTIGCSSRST